MCYQSAFSIDARNITDFEKIWETKRQEKYISAWKTFWTSKTNLVDEVKLMR